MNSDRFRASIAQVGAEVSDPSTAPIASHPLRQYVYRERNLVRGASSTSKHFSAASPQGGLY